MTTTTNSPARIKVFYRAIHTRTLWRKVGSHLNLEKAIYGVDGAAGLFAHRVRIDYEKHGGPCYVLVWLEGASTGYAIKPDSSADKGIRVVSVSMSDLLAYERKGQASATELEHHFLATISTNNNE